MESDNASSTPNQNLRQPDSLLAGLPIENRHLFLSIDRITLCGSFEDPERFLPRWEALFPDVPGRNSNGDAYRYSWIMDDYFFQALPFTKEKAHDARIDFNPNTIKNNQSFVAIMKMLRHSHLTRLDIAVDYVDIHDLSNFFLECLPKGRRPWHDPHTRKLKAVYFGSQKSTNLYRIYDKKRELREKKNIDADCETWWRVEAQMKLRSYDQWENFPLFSDLIIAQPTYDGSILPFPDLCILKELHRDPTGLQHLTDYKRRKFGRLIKTSEHLETINQHPHTVITSNLEWLHNQITHYIGE